MPNVEEKPTSLSLEERAQARRYGPGVYGAYLVLHSAGHGKIREDAAVRIAISRLRAHPPVVVLDA